MVLIKVGNFVPCLSRSYSVYNGLVVENEDYSIIRNCRLRVRDLIFSLPCTGLSNNRIVLVNQDFMTYAKLSKLCIELFLTYNELAVGNEDYSNVRNCRLRVRDPIFSFYQMIPE